MDAGASAKIAIAFPSNIKVLQIQPFGYSNRPTFDLSVSAGDFEVQPANGQHVDSSPESVVSDQLVDTILAPGDKETKTVVFQLPASEETLHLLYDFDDQHIDIDLRQ